MIDYLEPLEEKADVLLEAERRLEELLTGSTAGTEGIRKEAQEAGRAAEGVSEAGSEDPRWALERALEEETTAVSGGAAFGEAERISPSEEQERLEEATGPAYRAQTQEAEEPPLLIQLEALERTALAADRLGTSGGAFGSNRRTVYELGETSGATGWRAAEGRGASESGNFPAAGETARMGSGRSSWGEELSRAEELDRAFRRDSRRYDGGFFLY